MKPGGIASLVIVVGRASMDVIVKIQRVKIPKRKRKKRRKEKKEEKFQIASSIYTFFFVLHNVD